MGHPVLIRVSPGYPSTKGGLPTCYSPVRRFPLAEARFSLDLHVLSAPPAFVLSQDQTLREELVAGRSRRNLHFELVLKGRPTRGKREDDEVLMSCSGEPDQVSTLEERSLLSFQRPVPRQTA